MTKDALHVSTLDELVEGLVRQGRTIELRYDGEAWWARSGDDFTIEPASTAHQAAAALLVRIAEAEDKP